MGPVSSSGCLVVGRISRSSGHANVLGYGSFSLTTRPQRARWALDLAAERPAGDVRYDDAWLASLRTVRALLRSPGTGASRPAVYARRVGSSRYRWWPAHGTANRLNVQHQFDVVAVCFSRRLL